MRNFKKVVYHNATDDERCNKTMVGYGSEDGNIVFHNILRHEEFQKGCEAQCNGPYDGRWSKTMVGYGSEDTHFVLELTYNYNVKNYNLGNDIIGIIINSSEPIKNASKYSYPITCENGRHLLISPSGYKFYIEESKNNSGIISEVVLASSNLPISLNYWNKLLGLSIFNETSKEAILGYNKEQAKIKLVDIGKAVDHASAYGRIAFSCQAEELPIIQKQITESKHTILTPLISLDTPGKTTVQVVILADPDGHEICFVGDKAFQELSQIDPKAEDLLENEILQDNSDEWFKKHGLQKTSL